MGIKNRIIVELTPASIDGAVIRMGRVVRASRVMLEPTNWRQAWEEGLSQFDSKLKDLIVELGASGARVDVAYQSTSSFAEVITVPVTGSAVANAARLSLADHVGFDLQLNPHSISPISTSKSNGAKSTHTLAIADVASVSQTLSAWVERAGCHLAGAMPTSAMMLGDAIDESRSDRDDSDSTSSVSMRLFMDRHGALLTVVSGGEVRLVRRIEVGFEDFVTSITRPITRPGANGADDETIQLSPGAARAILCEHGIPNFRTIIDEELGLKGKDILPLIQPALQRMGIEIKQSLRFELTKEEHESAQLRLAGPFGPMRNLASAICDQVEIPPDQSGAGTLERSRVEAPFHGELPRAGRLARCVRSNSIVSNQIVATQRFESFRIGVRAGAAAAALALVATAYVMYSQANSERQSTQRLGDAMIAVDQIIEINESITVRSGTLAATQKRMGVALGMTMRWSDVLSALPGLIPDAVALSEIEGSEQTENESPKIELSGVAKDTDGQSCQEALNVFIESLKACPLVASVNLGVTNRVGQGSQESSLRFSAVINLVATPRLAVIGDAQEEPR